MLRALVYYVASVGLLSLFGCEVCPYIESLGRFTLAGLFTLFFGIAFVARWPLEKKLVLSAPPLEQVRRQFLLDLGSFVAIGVALTLWDRIIYGFPVTSGMKALLGAATIGLFFATDSALARERVVVADLIRRGDRVQVGNAQLSMTRKFVVVALGTLTLLVIDLSFLALGDLRQSSDPTRSAHTELIIESVIALAFFFPLTINLILSFARNLRLFLGNQRKVLEEVSRGRFDVQVPVASSDEFGVIAGYTNQMIDSLRERERVRDLFGKLVSPAIAQRLLAGEALNLGGSRRPVVVLFSDIRNFTTRTEHSDPEQIVSDLNRYFGKMVEIVHAHGGIVDKFIGDGMMAIFGLEDVERGAADGVRAARAMLDAVTELNRELSQPIEIGIGLHAGEVVAGTIGAPSRLEFTFIGDTVNVAARLEGLTREIGSPLVISQAVLDAVEDKQFDCQWTPCGARSLKGRTGQVQVYALQLPQTQVA